MYKIVVDRTHALIRLDMHGMLTPPDADQLVADRSPRSPPPACPATQ